MATSSEKNKIIKLSTAEYTTLSTTGTLTKDGVTYTYSPSDTIYVTPDAISGLSEYKEQLRLICNRYLDSTDRLPIDCTWEDLIAVFNEYDEYSYMNAFLNSIEVFPDKDYSINDTEGHIEGIRSGALQNNTALKSIFFGGSLVFDSTIFNGCSNLETVFYGTTPSVVTSNILNVIGQLDSLKKIIFQKIEAFSHPYSNAQMLSSCPLLKFVGFPKCTNMEFKYNSLSFSGSTSCDVFLVKGGTLDIRCLAILRAKAFIITDQTAVATCVYSGFATEFANRDTVLYVPASLQSTYASATNWSTVEATRTIQDIESHINSLRELGADFSFTPYANKKWENNQLVDDATIGEEVDE